MSSRNISFPIVVISIIFFTQAVAAENSDELYQQGRFAEAEKAYAASDMDHPKDIRYRYNRGSAAYQNSDYQGAAAAFSSVIRRAKDNKIKFKAVYNLGNTAFKQGDFSSAVAHYKQAILNNPESEDARHNLELALRELEKSKKEEQEQQNKQHSDDSPHSEDQKEKTESSKNDESQDKSSKDKSSEHQEPQPPNQKEEKGQRESEQKKSESADEDRKDGQESTKDLSGELEPLREQSGEQDEDQDTGSAISMIDKKKAEALLDNIKENRLRFLHFQIPEKKRHGVQSGKDW